MKIFNHLLEIKRFRFLLPILVLSALFTHNPKRANADFSVVETMTCPVTYLIGPEKFPIIHFWKEAAGWKIKCGEPSLLVCPERKMIWLNNDTPSPIKNRVVTPKYQFAIYPTGTVKVTFRYYCTN